jgi:hypothetical protein
VTVVLPASMWAMMPRLRQRESVLVFMMYRFSGSPTCRAAQPGWRRDARLGFGLGGDAHGTFSSGVSME